MGGRATKFCFSLLILSGCFWSLAAFSWAQTPLGTAFKYQGMLTNAGAPATGAFDLQFSLFDGSTAGTQVGSTLSVNDLAVTNGVVNVDLDFGTGAFGGDARWLEIAVRPGASTGAYTTLSPRTQIQPTPYALHAADAASVGGIDGSAVLEKIRSFVVGSGRNVKVGDVVSFVQGGATIRPGYDLSLAGFGPKTMIRPAQSGSMSVAALDSSRVVIGYASGGIARSVVARLEGGNIAFGPEITFEPDDLVSSISVCVLSATRAFICWAGFPQSGGPGGPTFLRGVVADVQGLALSPGTDIILDTLFDTGFPLFNLASASALSPTQVVIGYRDEINALGKVTTCSISGTTITPGSPIPFNTGATSRLSTTPLSTSKFVVAYADGANSSIGTCAIGTVTSNAITLGPDQFFNVAATDGTSVATLSPTTFVVAFHDSSNMDAGTAVIGTVVGNSAAFGAKAIFKSQMVGSTAISVISPEAVLIGFVDHEANSAGGFVTGKVSGDTLLFSEENFFSQSSTADPAAIAALSSAEFMVAFADAGNTNLGTAVGGILRPSPILGVARAVGTAGQSVPVGLFVNRGISDVHSGLTVGASYFGRPDGSISTNNLGIPIGLAFSPTEILFIP